MGKFFSMKDNATRKIIKRLRNGRHVVESPLAETRGQQAAKLLRFTARGISDQFKDQTEYRGNSAIAWQKKHAFGTKSARGKTMLGEGDYRKSWLGRGPGSIESITDNVLTVGVDRGVHPQVAIHQGSASSVTVKPKTHIKAGTITVHRVTKGGRKYTQTRKKDATDWTMRFFLGLTYGVWLTKARLEKGLVIARRRLSVSTEVRKAIANMVKNETRKQLGVKTLRAVS